MKDNPRNRSDFMEAFVIYMSMRAAVRQRVFRNLEQARRHAEKLLAAMESPRSIYGRQLRMLQLMQKGATLQTMLKALHCSRRTIFRYLNHLEQAGVEISLEGETYRVKDGLLTDLGI